MIIYHGCSELKDDLVMSPELGIHPAGWLTESSDHFHGKIIAYNKWSFENCKMCHGSNYRGGNSGKDCYKCHIRGPEACNLCHGGPTTIYPPKALNGDTAISFIGVGVHNMHLTMDSTIRYAAKVECNECHIQITSFSDSNHIGNNPDGIAEIVFGTLAKTQTTVIPNPTWNRTTKTCSEVYCHGDFKNGNMNTAPIWTDPNSVVCGSCHGNPNNGNPRPKGTHPTGYNINDCYTCHGSVINQSGQIINKTLHVNGVINF